jgi:hypothetical protein
MQQALVPAPKYNSTTSRWVGDQIPPPESKGNSSLHRQTWEVQPASVEFDAHCISTAGRRQHRPFDGKLFAQTNI